MDNSVEMRPSRLRTLYYWTLLLLVLIVLDDLTFGWIYWGLTQINLLLSVVVSLVVAWSLGFWLTLRGLEPTPGKIAGWFLNRLQLERKNPELRSREEGLKNRVTSIGAAVPMAILFGGVITTLWLRRRGVVSDSGAHSLGFWLSGLYAVEFTLIHSLGIGGSIFLMRQ